MSKNEELVLAKRPTGDHDLKETWKLQQCEYPKINGEGQFICETLFVSVDPYLSSQIKKSALGGAPKDIGTIQNSYTVVKVVESQSTSYPVGTVYVASQHPWRRFFLIQNEKDLANFRVKILKQPNQPENVFDRLGYQSALGAFGMPSQTAYYGCLDVGKFKESDVLVVSGAAGAVGMVAGQIAKHVLKCKKVIGIAGGQQKCDFVTKELGLDACIDYKEYNTKDKMAAKLKEVAGDPVTAYFDNTGGISTEAVFDIIGRFGRIVICGQISSYTKSEEKAEEAYVYPNYLAKTVYRALSILGFVVADFVHRNEKEFYPDMGKWLESGQVKYRDTIVEGFENIPKAYEMLFTGANIGKVIVKV